MVESKIKHEMYILKAQTLAYGEKIHKVGHSGKNEYYVTLSENLIKNVFIVRTYVNGNIKSKCVRKNFNSADKVYLNKL